MSLTAKETETIEAIVEGVYTAVCYSVIDVGQQYSEKYDKLAHKVIISWEIPELRIDVERKGKRVNLPRAISKRYTVSLGEKAILRKDLEAWRAKAFTDADLKGFDLKNLLGAACQLQVIHARNDGKTFANVGGLMALPKNVKAPKPENELLFFSFEEAGDNPVIPDSIPEWIVNIIKQSKEWQRLTIKQKPAMELAQATKSPAAAGGAEDDDVPF
jgi:hypothetical protein